MRPTPKACSLDTVPIDKKQRGTRGPSAVTAFHSKRRIKIKWGLSADGLLLGTLAANAYQINNVFGFKPAVIPAARDGMVLDDVFLREGKLSKPPLVFVVFVSVQSGLFVHGSLYTCFSRRMGLRLCLSFCRKSRSR